MGNLFSRLWQALWGLNEKESSLEQKQPVQSKKAYSWDQRDREDMKSYTVDGYKAISVCRFPGTINGQQFQIANCEGTTILLLDIVDSMMVDDCHNCLIIVGPVKSSVYLRNCTDCTVFAACGQLRTRDCRKLDLVLYCPTQPCIESSTELRFAPLKLSYMNFKDYLVRCELEGMLNMWDQVHDFTPSELSPNFTLIKDLETSHFMPKIPEECTGINLKFGVEKAISPAPLGPPNNTNEIFTLKI